MTWVVAFLLLYSCCAPCRAGYGRWRRYGQERGERRFPRDSAADAIRLPLEKFDEGMTKGEIGRGCQGRGNDAAGA
jgi:hypothetical protein